MIGYDVAPPSRFALVIGGTRGIGGELADLLHERGWAVLATGQKDFDLGDPDTWAQFMDNIEVWQFDFVCFCAGYIDPFPWDRKSWTDYLRSYAVHAAGPIHFLARFKQRFPWWTRVCFVSSVGAINEGVVDLGYGMAKAALDKAARALKEHMSWPVHLVRFDLVSTDTMYRIPTETMHGRPTITARQAAEAIVGECEL